MKRSEFVIAAAWDAGLSHTMIGNIENGANLDDSHYCNTNAASPQGSTTTDISGSNPTIAFDNNNSPTAKDTIAACLFNDCVSSASGAGGRALRTGSASTSACVSRYGIQDLVGNLREYTSDQILCDGSTCSGVNGGTADSSNLDFSAASVFLDGATQSPKTDTSLTSYGNKLQLPIALPVSPSFTGPESVLFTSAKLHGDWFYITNVNAGTRSTVSGGHFITAASGPNAGRFYVDFTNSTTGISSNIGFRCTMLAE